MFPDRRDLSGQIYRQLRAAILDGRLRAGDPLLPTRELALQLAVARNTVAVAYERLAGEGFVSGRVGAGTFVSGAIPSGDSDFATPVSALAARAVWDAIPDPPDMSVDSPEFDFRAGLPDARLFPYETWRRLVARELRPGAVGTGAYAGPAGHHGLRAAIARHIGVSRGVRADPDDIVITNGIQQALDLLVRVLLEPGAVVAVEDPAYPPPCHLFTTFGARVVAVPVDSEGLVVDALPDDARLVYVTPSHQFPLGMPMSLRRRMALLAWASRHEAAVVEDDYDSEFRFGGHPLEPLHDLDTTGRVLYVGSFSKTMLPTLRLGFLLAPPSLRSALHRAKHVSDWHTALPAQAALARFIDGGYFARHLRKMRNEYRARFRRIAEVLTRDFGRWLIPIPSAAGMHLSARCHDGTLQDWRAVVHRARAAGVGLHSLWPYNIDDTRPGVVLGYGAIPADRIDKGLDRLRRCLEEAG